MSSASRRSTEPMDLCTAVDDTIEVAVSRIAAICVKYMVFRTIFATESGLLSLLKRRIVGGGV